MIWQRLYSKTSGLEKGTLQQLKSLLRRSAVPADPEKNVKSTEDFLQLVLVGHILVAAQEVLNDKHYGSVHELSECIVDRFVELGEGKLECNGDRVLLYASELLTLGLLWMSFYDAIREGDGKRIVRVWKFLLISFRATRHHNYAKEAFNLLMQVEYLCSERTKAQILWGRFINTAGRQGCNMPCDLFMEHLNRRLKGVIRNIGANVTKSSLTRASRSVNIIEQVCQTLLAEVGHKQDSNYHCVPRFEQDLTTVVTVLTDAKVFCKIPKRQHCSFKFKHGLFVTCSKEEIKDWIFGHISNTIL